MKAERVNGVEAEVYYDGWNPFAISDLALNRCVAIWLMLVAWPAGFGLAASAEQTGCDAALDRARDAIQQQQAQQAEAIIRTTLPNCADNAETYALLGMSLDGQGRFAAARDAFLRAIGLAPGWASLHNNLAMSYLHAGNHQAAEAEFHKALRIDPQNEIATLNLANLSIERKQFQPAIQILLSKDLATIGDPAWFMSLVEAYLGVGDAGTAAKTAGMLVDRAGGDASILFSLGMLFARYGRPQDALRWFERIPDAERDSPTYQDIGLAYAALGKTDDAENSFRTAMRVDPNDPHTYLELAEIFLASGRSNDALLILRTGHEKGPKNADITFALAETLIHLNSLEEAASLLTAAVKDEPRSAMLEQARGDLLNSQHRDEESAAAYLESLRLDPNRIDSRLGLASLHQRTGKSAQAQSDYAAVLRLAPGCAAGDAGLGTIALDQGRVAEAIRYLSKAVKEDPGNITAGESLATAYLRSSDYELAEQLAERLLKSDPENSQIHYLEGRALLKLNKGQEAQQEFEKAQQLVAANGTKPEERVRTVPEGCSPSIPTIVQTAARFDHN